MICEKHFRKIQQQLFIKNEKKEKIKSPADHLSFELIHCTFILHFSHLYYKKASFSLSKGTLSLF